MRVITPVIISLGNSCFAIDFWICSMSRIFCYSLAICYFINEKVDISLLQVLPEKVYFRSQILERTSIGEYWNISGVPVLPENVIFMFFRTCSCYSEVYNTGTQKWSSIVQYSCTSIWDLKYTFSVLPNSS